MAVLYVAEFHSIAPVNNPGASAFASTPIAFMPPSMEQTVPISSSSATSNPFAATTRFIRVSTDTTCSIAIGTNNPAATTSNARLAANQTEYFGVLAGQQIAVIANS